MMRVHGAATFTTLAAAIAEGFDIFHPAPTGHVVRKRTGDGTYVFAEVVTDERRSEERPPTRALYAVPDTLRAFRVG